MLPVHRPCAAGFAVVEGMTPMQLEGEIGLAGLVLGSSRRWLPAWRRRPFLPWDHVAHQS